MARISCPDCGYTHDCGDNNLDMVEVKTNRTISKLQTSKGYSTYNVPCRCGCGCGHSCDLVYGPYVKIYNEKGRAALEGELGEQLKAMREASAKVRREHMAKIHASQGHQTQLAQTE